MMTQLRTQLVRAIGLFRKRGREAEMMNEFQQHLDRLTERKIAAGMSPGEARNAARREFGGVEQIREIARDERVWMWPEQLWKDFRFAVRQLRKSPAFTFVAILTLALGIGANVALFSVVNAVLLRPLAYPAPERLVSISSTSSKNEIGKTAVSYPDFNDWRQQAQSFESIAGFVDSSAVLGGNAGEPERLVTAGVFGDYFAVLGVEPALGRRFLPDENAEGKNRVTILSHAFWQRRFGGDAAIVGQQISLNGNPFLVVGVMPAGLEHPIAQAARSVELWLPVGVVERMRTSRRNNFIQVIGRLKPNVTLETARAEMKTIAAGLAQQYPETNTGWSVAVDSLHETLTAEVRPALLVLSGAVAFLLLIACANVANLLLARATTRQREMAVRAALGASRGRIVRQLLTENVLLSLTAGAAGLLLASWGTSALLALSPGDIPRLASVHLDAQVLLFAVGLSVVTGILFGLAPALTVTKLNLNDTLKQGGRSASAGATGRPLRSALTVAQIALSLMLLVGAGLLIRSFLRLQEVKPGFNPSNLLAAELALPPTKYAENQQVVQFYDQLLARLAEQPAIKGAALTTTLPLAESGEQITFYVEGRPVVRTERLADAETRVVSPDYFRTMEIPLRRGRLLTDQDTSAAPRAIVINETLARKYFANEEPLGKRITFTNPEALDTQWWTIVGIVGDVRQISLQAEPYAQAYRSYRQVPKRAMTVILRTEGDPLAMLGTLREQVWSFDRQQPLANARSVEQVLARSIAQPRFNMFLIAVLAGVALVLAAVGIYGVISYSVTQRTHEIGIRMALGATASNVLRLIVSHGMVLAGAGLAMGVLGALAATQVMSTLLYGVTATDPVTYVALVLLLGVIAMIASVIPALRATKVDPVVALRHD